MSSASSSSSTPAQSGRWPHLHSLTIARGIAAWLVVFYHIRSAMPWMPDTALHFFAKGYLAVDFFFLLSGFVIYLSAHQNFLDQGKAAIRPFLLRRLARIYPLYAAMLLFTIAFAVVLMATGRDASGYPLSELPLHALMMQNWGFTEHLSWNHPAWSISTEMAAYLLFPLLILVTPITRASRSALLVAILVALGTMAVWLHLAGLKNLGEYIVRCGLIRCLFEFSAGAMLCSLWLQGISKRENTPIRIAILALLCGGALWIITPSAELFAFPIMAAAALYLLAEAARHHSTPGSFSSPVARAFIYLGEISYATYLLHFMFFVAYKAALVRDAAHIVPWKIALFLLLTLILSALLHHLVEKPGRSLFTTSLRNQHKKMARAELTALTREENGVTGSPSRGSANR